MIRFFYMLVKCKVRFSLHNNLVKKCPTYEVNVAAFYS